MLLVTTRAPLLGTDINQAHQPTNSQKAKVSLKALSIRKRTESQSVLVLVPMAEFENIKILLLLTLGSPRSS